MRSYLYSTSKTVKPFLITAEKSGSEPPLAIKTHKDAIALIRTVLTASIASKAENRDLCSTITAQFKNEKMAETFVLNLLANLKQLYPHYTLNSIRFPDQDPLHKEFILVASNSETEMAHFMKDLAKDLRV